MLFRSRQFFLSAVSLAFHDRAPGFDSTDVLKEVQEKFLPFRREWMPGTHFELGFGHLDGYSAIYYTYQWSTVIAKVLRAPASIGHSCSSIDGTSTKSHSVRMPEMPAYGCRPAKISCSR